MVAVLELSTELTDLSLSLSVSLSLYDCLAKCSDLHVLQSFPTNRNVKNSFLVEI
jgi:hypothetical protein